MNDFIVSVFSSFFLKKKICGQGAGALASNLHTYEGNLSFIFSEACSLLSNADFFSAV
jgi:hypothetical protein